MNALGVILILIGVIFLFRPVIEGFLKINNTLRGVKSDISNTTILFYRIIAVIWVVIFTLYFWNS